MGRARHRGHAPAHGDAATDGYGHAYRDAAADGDLYAHDPHGDAGATNGHARAAHGDAHAGPWHRQVSLLADESIAKLRAQMRIELARLEVREFLAGSFLEEAPIAPVSPLL